MRLLVFSWVVVGGVVVSSMMTGAESVSMSFMVALDIEIMTGCLERGGRLTIELSDSMGGNAVMD